MTSQLHRSLVPIQVWLLYLLQGGYALSSSSEVPKDEQQSSHSYYTAYVSTFMGIVLMVAYVVVKGKLIWAQLGSWRVAASKLWQCTVRFDIMIKDVKAYSLSLTRNGNMSYTRKVSCPCPASLNLHLCLRLA